jgi:hypothetical protein
MCCLGVAAVILMGSWFALRFGSNRGIDGLRGFHLGSLNQKQPPIDGDKSVEEDLAGHATAQRPAAGLHIPIDPELSGKGEKHGKENHIKISEGTQVKPGEVDRPAQSNPTQGQEGTAPNTEHHDGQINEPSEEFSTISGNGAERSGSIAEYKVNYTENKSPEDHGTLSSTTPEATNRVNGKSNQTLASVSNNQNLADTEATETMGTLNVTGSSQSSQPLASGNDEPTQSKVSTSASNQISTTTNVSGNETQTISGNPNADAGKIENLDAATEVGKNEIAPAQNLIPSPQMEYQDGGIEILPSPPSIEGEQEEAPTEP